MSDLYYPYFKNSELQCRCGECGKGQESMDPEFMLKIIELRSICDFPFVITSAYRCPKYNAKVSSTGENGPHTTGKAIDILVSYEKADLLLRAAINQNYMTGIGINQKGNAGQRFLHLDKLEPRIWSY